jgi:plastocyanin
VFEWRHRARSARRTLIAFLICGLVALTACSAPPVVAGVALQSDTIVIEDFSFQPGGVVVTPGATVTVINNGVTAHTVTAINREFDSGVVGPSRRVTFTAPTVPGKYLYICMFHQYMRGFVSVVPSRPSSG